ncbi:MAG TPA: four helix bundle protein [Cyclobacteriaceae bacterium]|nr:four helix bundle protein [Cyclobacteriaceae bacterium]
MGFKFENLRVWQLAIDLTLDVNELSKKFPSVERYILAQQIQRAADSVALNIAEGSTGQSNAEYKRFLGFSIRSAIEVVSCLYIGRKRKIISENDFSILYEKYDSLIRSIQALKNSIS